MILRQKRKKKHGSQHSTPSASQEASPATPSTEHVMCQVPGTAFRQAGCTYEGHVLSSRFAKPGTMNVNVPEIDNNIYVFDSKLVRKWIKAYNDAHGVQEEQSHPQSSKRTRQSSKRTRRDIAEEDSTQHAQATTTSGEQRSDGDIPATARDEAIPDASLHTTRVVSRPAAQVRHAGATCAALHHTANRGCLRACLIGWSFVPGSVCCLVALCMLVLDDGCSNRGCGSTPPVAVFTSKKRNPDPLFLLRISLSAPSCCSVFATQSLFAVGVVSAIHLRSRTGARSYPTTFHHTSR